MCMSINRLNRDFLFVSRAREQSMSCRRSFDARMRLLGALVNTSQLMREMTHKPQILLSMKHYCEAANRQFFIDVVLCSLRLLQHLAINTIPL
jgi:hypothetical protein